MPITRKNIRFLLVFIHRDATFEAYNYFFAAVKASLSSKSSLRSFEQRLGKDMYIGSHDETALVNAIDRNFPASNRFLCTKHVKDGTVNYLQTKVGVPQKERKNICKSIFGEKGIAKANDSQEFGAMSKDVLVQVTKYPTFQCQKMYWYKLLNIQHCNVKRCVGYNVKRVTKYPTLQCQKMCWYKLLNIQHCNVKRCVGTSY